MTSDHNKERDEITGVETTGHDWDGLKELNNPAPRWWLLVFLVCCIWAFGYWVIYPAWPTISGEGERGGTRGSKGWTEYKQLKEDQAEIVARKASYLESFRNSSFQKILNNSELYNFALAGGKAAFKDNCATCHGTGGAGGKGYPNLNDDDWLWGGSIDDIYQTIKYGIRSGHDETRFAEMPMFKESLKTQQVSDISDYVVSLSTGVAYPEKGALLFKENCAACHGSDGRGSREVGAPNLADGIWLLGGGRENIINQINNPKHGVMPEWVNRLDDDTIKQLTIYVHSLGGGE